MAEKDMRRASEVWALLEHDGREEDRMDASSGGYSYLTDYGGDDAEASPGPVLVCFAIFLLPTVAETCCVWPERSLPW